MSNGTPAASSVENSLSHPGLCGANYSRVAAAMSASLGSSECRWLGATARESSRVGLAQAHRE